MSTGERWTPEQDAILRECYPHMRANELVEKLVEAGFPKRSEKAIAARTKVIRVFKDESYDRFAPRRVYTAEENDFFREYVPGHHWQEIADEFEKRFGRRLTQRQVNNRKIELGLKSGTVGGRHEKGNVPWSKGKKFPGRPVPNAWEKGHVPHNQKARLSTRSTTGATGPRGATAATPTTTRPTSTPTTSCPCPRSCTRLSTCLRGTASATGTGRASRSPSPTRR